MKERICHTFLKTIFKWPWNEVWIYKSPSDLTEFSSHSNASPTLECINLYLTNFTQSSAICDKCQSSISRRFDHLKYMLRSNKITLMRLSNTNYWETSSVGHSSNVVISTPTVIHWILLSTNNDLKFLQLLNNICLFSNTKQEKYRIDKL